MHNFNLKKLYIGIFLVICLIPSLFMIVLGPSKSGANEILASEPKFGVEVLSECGDYIDDRFAFRQELISAWTWINSHVFNTSVESKIVLGSNDWLYYSSDLNDYRGVCLTDSEIDQIALNLKKLQDEVESTGAKFVFISPPNKSGYCSDNMPKYITKGNINNATLLEEAFSKHKVNYVNLFKLDMDYYITDSHWTYSGAAVAVDEILGTNYSTKDFVNSGYHTGDLFEMMYPAFECKEDELVYGPGFTYESKKDTNNGNAITIETTCEGKSGSLYCWRDSFGIYMYPFLAESFEKATFSRSTKYDVSEIGENDLVILEIGERNLKNLL